MKNLMTFLMILLAISCYSQNAPDWDATPGTTGRDYGATVIEVPGEGYVMAGYENTETGNALLVKTSFTGEQLWVKSFGESAGDRFNDVVYTGDGYVMVGFTKSIGNGNDRYRWMVKSDTDGNELWNISFEVGIFRNIQQTTDNGFIISGGGLTKTDALGNIEWQLNDVPSGYIIQTSDGGYAQVYSTNDYSLIMEKLYSNGTVEWSQTYPNGSLTFAGKLQQTSDDGFIFCSTKELAADQMDAWVTKTDASGNLEWIENYGGLNWEQADDIKQTPDGGYIFTGISCGDSPEWNNDIWVVKIDAQGTMQWEYSYDYPFQNYPYTVLNTSEGGYIVGGTKYLDADLTDADMWLVHFPADPLTAWFTADPTQISAGETVDFSNGSLGTTTDWLWSFPGGIPETSTEENPSVEYPSNGLYSVTLSVNGGLSELTRTEYITVDETIVVSYCNSSGNANTRWISNVSVDGNSNGSGSSGDLGYEDFTDFIYSLESGGSYNVALTPGQAPGKKTPLWWRLWIDYNMDGNFTGDELAFAADGEKSAVSGVITLPEGIYGETRMRVALSKDGIPQPCDIGFIGEVEDYTVSLITPVPQPPVADFTSDVTYISVGTTVYYSDQSLNDPTSWLWSFDTGTGTDLTSTLQNPSVTYNIAGTFDVTLTATSSIGSDTETKVDYVIVTEQPPMPEYCEPVNIQNSHYNNNIDAIYVGSYSNVTGFNGIGNGFVYYYSLPAFEYTAGENVSVTLIPGDTRTRFAWRIWMDLNGDGDFEDTDELMFLANNKKGEVNGSITIPTSGLTTEVTRMRISMKNGNGQQPCDDGFEGEVEDYNVQFLSGAKSAAFDSADSEINRVKIYPNPVSGDKLNIQVNNELTYDLKLYDARGALLRSYQDIAGATVIDVADFQPGIYFVNISTVSFTEIKRLIIK